MTGKPPTKLNRPPQEPIYLIYLNEETPFRPGGRTALLNNEYAKHFQLYAYRTQNGVYIISKTKTLVLLQFLAIAVVIAVFLGHSLLTTARQGVVTGILYTTIESSSAVIDGQIVKEGDTIHNVTVTKIHKSEVEFEKNGKRWKQRVGQRPNPAWTENEDVHLHCRPVVMDLTLSPRP